MSKVAKECEVGLQPYTQSAIGTMIPISWANPRPGKYEVGRSVDTKSIEDIVKALREIKFLESEMTINRGLSAEALVVFGIDTTGKAYYATDPPVEVEPLSPESKLRTMAYRVIVSGPDFPVFKSPVYALLPGNWNSFHLGKGEPVK